MIPRSGVLVAIALFATLIASQPASARGLTTGLIDDDLFTSSARNLWLDRAKDAGTGLIRVNVPWREVVASTLIKGQ